MAVTVEASTLASAGVRYEGRRNGGDDQALYSSIDPHLQLGWMSLDDMHAPICKADSSEA